MTREIRVRIAIAVCALVLLAGGASAQPTARTAQDSVSSWVSVWVENARAILAGIWPGESELERTSLKSVTAAAAKAPPVDAETLDGETCRPGAWESCAGDPDG